MLRLLLPLLFFYSYCVYAFINIESLRLEMKEGFGGKFSLNYEGQNGNTEKTSISSSSLNIWRYQRDELLLLGDYTFGRTLGIVDTNNGRAHLRYTFDLKEARSYEFFTQSEFDQFKKLNSRTLAGGNIRYRLLQAEDHSFYFGVGAFFEHRDYSSISNRNGVRGNFYLSYSHKIKEHFSAFATTYYQPYITEFNDYRFQMSSGLEVIMTKVMAINISYDFSYDNFVPDPSVKRMDQRYLTGVILRY